MQMMGLACTKWMGYGNQLQMAAVVSLGRRRSMGQEQNFEKWQKLMT